MGPIALLDKSCLQSLSAFDARRFEQHYYLCIPPILIVEILADVQKYSGDQNRSCKEVSDQVNKLPILASKISVHWKQFATADFLGVACAPNPDQIPISGAVEYIDANGKKGLFLDQQPEEEALQRWHAQDFDESERLLATRWREVSRGIDLNAFRQRLLEANTDLPKLKTMEEVASYVDRLLSDQRSQRTFLGWAIIETQLTESIVNRVYYRWDAIRPNNLQEFAPYCFHILRANLFFNISLMRGLIGTKPTNRIDLEYLYYLPFCRVFSTADNMQAKIARALLGHYQYFVDADELKKDMSKLNSWWNTMSSIDQEEDAYQYGSHPPDFKDSFTCKLWLKMFGPRKKGSGNLALRMTPEQEANIIKAMQPSFDVIDKLTKH